MARTASGRPPNILFVLADQLRADFLSCYGAPIAAATVHTAGGGPGEESQYDDR